MCGSPIPCTTTWRRAAIREVRFSVTTTGLLWRLQLLLPGLPPGACHLLPQPRERHPGVKALTEHPGFKGYIHDVGGPSATFRRPSCQKQLKAGLCKNRACLAPQACPNLDADHTDYMMLLRKLREIPKVKRCSSGRASALTT